MSQAARHRRTKDKPTLKLHGSVQQRLQVLLVDEWKKSKKQRLDAGGSTKSRTAPGPNLQWLSVLESDWFVHVCAYVGPTGAYALWLLARTSRAMMQAMWHTSEARMRWYGMPDRTGARVPPMYSVLGFKRKYVAKTDNAGVHPIPNPFRIVAPSRLCRVCYGAQSAATHIKVKVGPHFASYGCTTVPVCEQCVMVHKAPAWTSVQVYLYQVKHKLGDALLQVVNMPTPIDDNKAKRRTSCGWPTMLLGPMCRAAGLDDAAHAQLAKKMTDTLTQARERQYEPEVARRALLDCAVMWGGVSAQVRRCLR